MHIRESGYAAKLRTRSFLGHWLLVFVIPLILEIFIRGGQVIRVMWLSLGYNLVEGLQVNVRRAERQTLDAGRSIWLKV